MAAKQKKTIKRSNPAQKTSSAQELVLNRNEFYRDGYRKVLNLTIILAVCLIVSVSVNVLFVMKKPVVQNFATSESGRIIPLKPLGEAFVNPEIVKDFVMKCALQTNSVTFGTSDHIKGQISDMQKYFTPKGFKNFLSALKKSGNIERVKKEKLIISAGALGAAVVLGEGTKNGVYGWKVEAPIILTVYNYKGKRTIERVVKMFVTRVPIVDNPRGIAVDQYLISNKQDK